MARMNAPIAEGSKRQAFFEIVQDKSLPRDAIRIRGCDYLGPVSSGALDLAGTCVSNIFIAPSEFGNTRLNRFSQLYEKYLFNRLQFHYQPGVPTTQKGSLIMAYDRDVDDATPPTNLDGVRQYLSFEGSKSSSVWEEFSIDCRLEARETPLWNANFQGATTTTADDRLTYQGQLYVAEMMPTGLAGQLGDLWVEYDCTLFVPALESISLTASLGNIGTTQSTLADALFPFVTGQPGQSTTGNTSPGLIPRLIPGIPNSGIQVAEGVYRLVNAGVNGAAAQNLLAAPTVIPNAPEPAPAPQAAVRQLLNLPSTAAAGAPWVSDFLVGVPKGGGLIQQACTNRASGNTYNLDIQKLSNSILSLGQYF